MLVGQEYMVWVELVAQAQIAAVAWARWLPKEGESGGLRLFSVKQGTAVSKIKTEKEQEQVRPRGKTPNQGAVEVVGFPSVKEMGSKGLISNGKYSYGIWF